MSQGETPSAIVGNISLVRAALKLDSREKPRIAAANFFTVRSSDVGHREIKTRDVT